MKILYLECNMGIAGDMLMSALLDLHPQKEEFMKRFGQLGIPNVTAKAQTVQKCGITGLHVSVKVDGEEEVSHDHHNEHEHSHDHEEHSHDHEEHSQDQHEHHHDSHEHSHGHDEHSQDQHEHHHDSHEHSHGHDKHSHSHHSMADIFHIVDGLPLSEKVRSDVKQVYKLIAEAESRVHGKTVTEIHFHEVGMADAIADICGCCMLMEEIKPDKIVCSAVNTGFGQVHCAHGVVPVPAPATALLLQGIPVYAGDVRGELTTPTGAALLKYFVHEYGAMPMISIDKVGYGMGQKDFAAANCVRAIIGEAYDAVLEGYKEQMQKTAAEKSDDVEFVCGTDDMTAAEKSDVVEFVCSIDDMTAEEVGYAIERLLDDGAVEAYASPITMKKSRPALELTVLAAKEDREKIVQKIFCYTTTIGFRERLCHRRVLNRRMVEKDTDYGKVRFKESSGYGVCRRKAEFEDLKRIAAEQGCSIAQARQQVEQTLR